MIGPDMDKVLMALYLYSVAPIYICMYLIHVSMYLFVTQTHLNQLFIAGLCYQVKDSLQRSGIGHIGT